MNHFYARLFGATGALMLTAGAYAYGTPTPVVTPPTMGPQKPLSQKITQSKPFNLYKNDTPPIEMRRGAFSADLSKWDVNVPTAVRSLSSWLGLHTPLDFQKITEKTDDKGVTHAFYQGYYKGIAVHKTKFMLHSKDGSALFINGYINTLKNPQINRSISQDQALSVAMEAFNVTDLYKTYPVEKLIMRVGEKEDSPFKLVYKTKIVSVSPFVMRQVFVDAQSGEIITSINLVNNLDTPGDGQTLYNGDQNFTVDSHEDHYRLRESDERKIETYDATHLTSISFSGDFVGVEDFMSSNTDFSASKIDTLKISQLSAEDEDEFYVKINDFDDETIYTSDEFNGSDVEISLTDIDESILNSPVSVEIWQKNEVEDDSVYTNFGLNLAEGSHQWDTEESEGTYTVSKTGNPALDAHWGMEETYDFYADVFGRESYDNNNSTIKQYLNPPAEVLSQYLGDSGLPNNAFALQDPFNIMVYGLGDNQLMGPVVGIDVEGHEFSHMVIDHNGYGGLDYQGESGALNESFADILGTCIEFYASDNPNWEIGENIAIYGSNFRSMEDPKSGGLSQQPDTYEGTYWADPNGYFDNGGVHTNSGVQNYWFYLVSEGGSGTNDNNDAYDVQGIGIEKAREIVYRNIMNYLSSTSDYMDAYAGSLQATKDLYGIPSEEYTAVSKAWYAVGIGDNPEEYCNGQSELTDDSGTFNDGSGENEDYVNNAHCTWLIQPDGADQIKLTFSDFNTEEGADYVVIYDGADSTANVLAEYSGNYIPNEVVSSTGSMYVEFYSDQANKRPGWTANYTTDLSVDSHEIDNEVNVFPNPTQGNVTVHSDLNEEMNLTVLDISGKVVTHSFTVRKGDNPISLADLSAGIYFLEFSSGNRRHVEKLIIE